jgi:exodeoxyribonuclease VII small subunit
MATKKYIDIQAELTDILQWFEKDNLDIDEAIAKYEEAIKLTKQLESYLKQAENKVKKIQAS